MKMQQLLKATSKLALCLVRINGNMHQFITVFNLSDKNNYLKKIFFQCPMQIYIFYFTYAGPTERAILKECETIIEDSLPISKAQQYYMGNNQSASETVLKYISLYEDIKVVWFI